MNFELISSDEFRKYADKSPYRSFTQTPEIAQYRESEGWTIYYFAVKKKEKILCATMAFAKPSFLGKSIYVTPGGPLLDLEDTELTIFFFKHLIAYAKSHNGYVLQISPNYELIERDRNGEVVENGFNHEKAVKNLERFNFKLCTDTSQPRYLFVLDIDGRSPEELFANFKQNKRNLIRKAERIGVTIRELKKEELDCFKQITESTSLRRNFSDRTLDYYKKIYDLFHNRKEVKFILAEAEIDGKKVPLSSAMFMLYGDEIIYLFSGSDEKYMHEYNAQYLIQWYMIKYAAEHHFKRYNFYGIKDFSNPKSKDYGIYSFKKGFDGHVVELIGTYEKPLNSFYYLHALLKKLKKH